MTWSKEVGFVNARILRGFHHQAATRPAWMPHPMMLNLIAALWLAAAALKLAELAHG